jgi:hypothetical protein
MERQSRPYQSLGCWRILPLLRSFSAQCRVEQLTDTLAAADCKLDSALKTKLDEVSIEFRRGDEAK